MKAPPIRGPATEARPYMPPISPVNIGLFTSGTAYAIMTRAPENIPADPTPATARPMIRATEVGAAPQMTEPTSKIKIAVKYTHLMLKKCIICQRVAGMRKL